MHSYALQQRQGSPFEKLYQKLASSKPSSLSCTPSLTPATHLLGGQVLSLDIDTSQSVEQLNEGLDNYAFAHAFAGELPTLTQLVERGHLTERTIAPALDLSNSLDVRTKALVSSLDCLITDVAKVGNSELAMIIREFKKAGLSDDFCAEIVNHDLLNIVVEHNPANNYSLSNDSDPCFYESDVLLSSDCFMHPIYVPVEQLVAKFKGSKKLSVEKAIQTLLHASNHLIGSLSVSDCAEMMMYIEPIDLAHYSKLEQNAIRTMVIDGVTTDKITNVVVAAILKRDCDVIEEFMLMNFNLPCGFFDEGTTVSDIDQWFLLNNYDLSLAEAIVPLLSKAIVMADYNHSNLSYLTNTFAPDLDKAHKVLKNDFPELAIIAKLHGVFATLRKGASDESSPWLVDEEYNNQLSALIIPMAEEKFGGSASYDVVNELYQGHLNAGEGTVQFGVMVEKEKPVIDLDHLWSFALLAALDVSSERLNTL